MEYFIWNADPIFFELGPIQMHWYGFLFILPFFLGYFLLRWICKRENKDVQIAENVILYILVGAVVGSRLMHTLAYEPEFYLANPIEILKIWEHSGLASHGGLLGVVFALYIFSKVHSISYWWLLSRIAIPGALTAAFIRFGNFFNSEILGLPSDKPWAIIFERVDLIPRHPVQLYEAFSYLLLVAILLGIYKAISSDFATKLLPGVFLTFMFILRFLLEYTKTPQAEYATTLPFSTGQILSIPFIIIGILWIFVAFKIKQADRK